MEDWDLTFEGSGSNFIPEVSVATVFVDVKLTVTG